MKLLARILLESGAWFLTGRGIHNIIGLVRIPLDRICKTKITDWLEHVWNPEETVRHMVTNTHIRSSIARNIHLREFVERRLDRVNQRRSVGADKLTISLLARRGMCPEILRRYRTEVTLVL